MSNYRIENNMQPNESLKQKHQRLTLEFTKTPSMCHILQGGFIISVQVGVSIKNLLCDQLMLDPAYVESRISTIFLDGKPVDDIEAAKLSDGSVLALSAAMPGLVGATMRRGGRYSELRRNIAYQQHDQQAQSKEGTITLKLFNVMADDLGPEFLAHGVLLNKKHLKAFLESRGSAFWEACRNATLDGKELNPISLKSQEWLTTTDLIELKIVSSN